MKKMNFKKFGKFSSTLLVGWLWLASTTVTSLAQFGDQEGTSGGTISPPPVSPSRDFGTDEAQTAVIGGDAGQAGRTIGVRAGEQREDNRLGLSLKWCPAGTVRLGEPGASVDATLTQGFWIGTTELTQQQYRMLLQDNPSQTVGGSLPVHNVTWNQANKFCQDLTQLERASGQLPQGWEYRLPTEAQWQYACQGGTTTKFYFGDDGDSAESYSWFSNNSQGQPHNVEEKFQNPWACTTCTGMFGNGAVTMQNQIQPAVMTLKPRTNRLIESHVGGGGMTCRFLVIPVRELRSTAEMIQTHATKTMDFESL